jgi:hypothetical protein
MGARGLLDFSASTLRLLDLEQQAELEECLVARRGGGVAALKEKGLLVTGLRVVVAGGAGPAGRTLLHLESAVVRAPAPCFYPSPATPFTAPMAYRAAARSSSCCCCCSAAAW